MIFRRKKLSWNRQPPYAVDVDWSNPLTKGLVSVINPAALNPKFTRVGTPSFGIVKGGRSLSGTGASLVTEGNLSFGSAATIFMFGNMPSTGGALVCGIGTSSAGNQLFGFQSTDGSITSHRALIRTANGGGISSVESSLGMGAATDIVPWCAVYDGTSSLRLYRNGVSDGVTTNNTAASGAMSLDNFSLGGVNRGTDGFAPSGNVQLLGLAWNRALSPDEVATISANPWQIFKPRVARRLVGAASGTSAVSADATGAYLIRNAISADIAALFNVRGAVSADGSGSYAIRATVQADSAASYAVRGSAQRDTTATYAVRGTVAADAIEAYAIRGAAQSDRTAAYSVRGSVAADLSSAYDVLSSNAVGSSLSAAYVLRGAVASDAECGYAVRGSAVADQAASYAIRSVVQRDAMASYQIEAAVSSVFADLAAAYNVDGIAVPYPTPEEIAAAVLSALNATTIPVELANPDDIAAAVLTTLNATTIPVDMKKTNGHTIIGNGTEADKFRSEHVG